MKITELLYGIDYSSDEILNIEIDSISYAEKEIKGKCLYVLIKKVGEAKAVYQPKEFQPCAVVCDHDADTRLCTVPIIRVPDARRALSFIYSAYYGINYNELKVIGITGTNGKTTTATLIKSILEYNQKKVGFISTGFISINGEAVSDENYSMTTPDPDKLYAFFRAMTDLGCEYAIMEVSSHALALGKVAPIKFHRAVFTNLSPEHLDFHGSIDSYFKTKSELFKQCSHGIFNVDDKYGKRLYTSSDCKKTSVGIIEDAECSAFNIEMCGLAGSQYIYRGSGFITPIELKLPGAFNIYNACLAMCCVTSLGIKPCTAKHALAEINEINGRFNIINGAVTVIIDYAHTSCAVEEALRFASSVKKQGCKLITVFGCGGERDREKRPMMAKAAQRFSDLTVVTSDNSRGEDTEIIISDILAGFDNNASYTVIKDRECAIRSAIKCASNGDTIIILGKGPERYNITKEGYQSFDEREIVLSALSSWEGI